MDLGPCSPGGMSLVLGKCWGKKVMNSRHEPLGIHQWAPQPRKSSSAECGRAWKTSKWPWKHL